MTYDMRSPDYLDPAKLSPELERVFDICQGCRLCHDLCPSFGTLFRRIDEGDGDVKTLHARDWDQVTDECYQCKLCVPKCPYTPPHAWAVDVPRLLLRAKAARAAKEGVTLQDRALSHTDLIGRVATKSIPLFNWALKNPVTRAVMHATAGIHRLRTLPTYARETFGQWYSRRASNPSAAPAPAPAQSGSAPAVTGGESAPAAPDHVALFYTCSVNYNRPEIGRAAVAVLEHNGVSVECPEQRCCGMPFLDGGDLANARQAAADNVAALLPAVRRGAKVVVPGPTCSYMMKQEYGPLLGTAEARDVAAATMDLFEFLAARDKAGKFDRHVTRPPGRVAYHVPCHLKAQNIGLKSRDLLRTVGAEIALVDKCCGVDGTWGFKKQHYETSFAIAEPALSAFRAAQPATVVTDCPLAAIQIQQGTGLVPRHPVSVLAEAYGLETE